MTNTKDDNWGWVRGGNNYRSANEIIHNLIDSTSKGGNFVVNVGPTASGDFPEQHVALVNTVGAWLDVNGAAIYGTEPAPECKPEAKNDFRCFTTKKGHSIYLHVLQWPNSKLPGTVTVSRGDLVKCELLDAKFKGLKVSTKKAGSLTTLTIQRPETIDPYATVIKLTFEKAVSSQPE